jgi:hypothetical protein
MKKKSRREKGKIRQIYDHPMVCGLCRMAKHFFKVKEIS